MKFRLRTKVIISEALARSLLFPQPGCCLNTVTLQRDEIASPALKPDPPASSLPNARKELNNRAAPAYLYWFASKL